MRSILFPAAPRFFDKYRIIGAGLLAACVVFLSEPRVSATPQAANDKLRSPASFQGIKDRGERSRALFSEAGKVITHARCMNCHPAGDQPSQGETLSPHLPAVVRGSDNHGAIGLRCNTCHQEENYAPSGVPGHPLWSVAPLEMAWQGHTLAEICAQLKDPKRNGGKTFAQLHEHMAHDTLVGWAWKPGAARKPAPGTQAEFGALIAAWIESGAECPNGNTMAR